MKFDRAMLVWAIIGFLLGSVVTAGGMALARQTRPVPIEIRVPEATPPPLPTATPGVWRVYVSGQVSRPGVYELSPGAIAQEAIDAAGGFTGQADTRLVNLAQSLSDGVQIYVPAVGEEVVVPPVVESVPAEAAPAGAATSSDGKVNINTAGVEELDTLPGIGPATAQSILDYRDANGPFATIEDIMNVSGIGPAKFGQIKDLITVD